MNSIFSKLSNQICKNWEIDDWEFYKKTIGDKVIPNDTGNWKKDKYDIPLNEIETNQCYVVIAHFADGTTAMSDVMIKY